MASRCQRNARAGQCTELQCAPGVTLSLPPSAGKLAGLDKKLSRSLEADVAEGSSPQDMGKSPMGPLSEASRCAAHKCTASSPAVSLQRCVSAAAACTTMLHIAVQAAVADVLCICTAAARR